VFIVCPLKESFHDIFVIQACVELIAGEQCRCWHLVSISCTRYQRMYVCMYPYSALMLLVGRQDGHPEKGPLNGCVCVCVYAVSNLNGCNDIANGKDTRPCLSLVHWSLSVPSLCYYVHGYFCRCMFYWASMSAVILPGCPAVPCSYCVFIVYVREF